MTSISFSTLREALDQAATRYEEILKDGLGGGFATPAEIDEQEGELRAALDRFGAWQQRLRAVEPLIEAFRARLVDDDDSMADVDLIYRMYCTLTGEEIPHPFDLEEEPMVHAEGCYHGDCDEDDHAVHGCHTACECQPQREGLIDVGDMLTSDGLGA